MELHFRVGDAHLGESWIRGVQWGWRWVAAREAFSHMASPPSSGAPKVLLERKHKPTLFPKLIVQLGLPIFLPLMGLCIRDQGGGTAGLFCPRRLSMGDFKLSSQFKEWYEYVASMLKFLGDVSRLPLFCLIIF